MDLKKAISIERLPFLRNFEDAQALYEKEHEPFYLAAFLIQCWLGGLVTRAAAEYAENKRPKARKLQSGESWGSFVEMFKLEPGKGCQYLLSCLFRFSAGDDSPGNSLRRALVPLSIEHRCLGDYFGPQSLHALEAKTVTKRATQADEGLPGRNGVKTGQVSTDFAVGQSCGRATGWTPRSICGLIAAGTNRRPASIRTRRPAIWPRWGTPNVTWASSMKAPKPAG